MSTVAELYASALSLEEDQRRELIESLIGSLERAEQVPVLSSAWEEEISRRIDDIESGAATTVPGDEVFARVRAIIDAAKNTQLS
jgi:putative addiction module component (TIGR02574 family)